jgi:hypothetical protein
MENLGRRQRPKCFPRTAKNHGSGQPSQTLRRRRRRRRVGQSSAGIRRLPIFFDFGPPPSSLPLADLFNGLSTSAVLLFSRTTSRLADCSSCGSSCAWRVDRRRRSSSWSVGPRACASHRKLARASASSSSNFAKNTRISSRV